MGRRRLRFLSTIFATCLALVMLGFGVYAATTAVTYDIEGTISYNVTDTYVEVNTKIYKSETLLTKAQLADKVEQVANLSFADISSDTSLTHLTTLDDTFTNVSNLSGAGEYSKGEDLDFTFATSGENVAFAYFIVMNVANLTQNPIYAVMQDDILDVENTFQYNNALQENILSSENNRNMVIGIMVDDLLTPITANSPFSYGINIGLGDVARSEQMTAKYYVDEESMYCLNEDAKGVIVLDPRYDGVTQTSGDYGLCYIDGVTAIYLRDGVDNISAFCFYNYNLTKLVVSGSASFIDGMQNCGKLYTIIVEEYSEYDIYTSRNEDGEELNCILCIEDIEDKIIIQGCNNTKFDLLPDGVTTIEAYAFDSCQELANITIPDELTSIGDRAFQSCRSFTSITIPASVTQIGGTAFSSCSGLESIVVHEDNEYFTSRINGEETNCLIEKGENNSYTVIRGCENSVIPNGVTSIGNEAFDRCTGLTSIIIPDSVTSIGNEAFFGCTSLTTVTLPANINEIGNQLFYLCTSLRSISIPDDVATIGGRAFEGCSSLASIVLPDNLETIDDSAFVGCTSLTTITIPATVSYMGSCVFTDWTEYQSIYFEGTTLPEERFSDWNEDCAAKIYLNGQLWAGE